MVLDAKRGILCVFVRMCALERACVRVCVCLLPVSALGHKVAAFAATPRLSANDCVLTGGLAGFTLTCILPGPNSIKNYSNDKK